jgi:MarR family
LDLLAALLLSIGANGLAAVLIAWSASAVTRTDPLASLASNAPCSSTPADERNSGPGLTVDQDHSEPRDGGTPVVVAGPRGPQPGPNLNNQPGPQAGTQDAVSARTRGVLRLIAQSGGTLTGSQRDLADQLGLPKSAMVRSFDEAREAGLISVQASRLTGTRVMMLV